MSIFRGIAAVTVLSAALGIGGCAILDEGTPNVCPSTAILDDAGELIRFSSATPSGPGDVAFRARMKQISGLCEVDEAFIDMELNTAMEAFRGPSNADGEAKFTYFVAILDKDKKVMSRIKFPMIAQFKQRETELGFSEALTITIPRKAGDLPKDYIVYLGFEMTPAELAYNRKKKRNR